MGLPGSEFHPCPIGAGDLLPSSSSPSRRSPDVHLREMGVGETLCGVAGSPGPDPGCAAGRGPREGTAARGRARPSKAAVSGSDWAPGKGELPAKS